MMNVYRIRASRPDRISDFTAGAGTFFGQQPGVFGSAMGMIKKGSTR